MSSCKTKHLYNLKIKMLCSLYFKNLSLKYRKIPLKWACVNCVRHKSSTEPKTKAYSHTIIFPKTDFPTRSNNAVKEEIQKSAQFADLYNWQKENLKGPTFVLHDGPPYANGDLHIGHAVNKIIKDINNRSQVLQGNKVQFIPGWDCHGLPIELKALQKAKKTNKNELTDPVQIRQIARTFALETVEKQKAQFKSWGIMADWDKQYYLTLNQSYVKNQLQKFYELYKMGLIYQALKPVYWSPSSRTALAEAELEYDPQFKSTEVYMKFPFVDTPEFAKDYVKGNQLNAVIWTTTPWTLPANKAICFSPNLSYSIVTNTTSGELYVVATSLVGEMEKILGVGLERVFSFEGNQLSNTTYTHPLTKATLPLLPSNHVTDGKGTGLVHTAPAHGPDDFLVALKHGISVECNVDASGRYTNIDEELNGLPVLSSGQDLVIKRLSSSILHRGTFVHSYPLDWRTKKPIILRASRQWFIDTAALKERALKALESIEILPQSSSTQSRQAFKSLLEKRAYWCISRQRAWGVPIPALYCGDKSIIDERIITRLTELMEEKGPDVWWTAPVEDLIPDDVRKDLGLKPEEVVKGQDIMDIWLDSGVSWHVAGVARLCAEGGDQLTGWFQASLLTALPGAGCAPYRSIFVHGFVVDENKRKMSKSIGNVVDPACVIKGDKGMPAFGLDTLRWWVASHSTQHSQIIISKKLLEDCQSEVIRIRNILKYLLGVVGDLSKTDFAEKPELNYFDQYLVKETQGFVENVTDHYNSYRYNHAALAILNFVSNKVSGLYCHCIKDRLYCSKKDSNERKSALLVIHTIFSALTKSLGPILPHLVEEAWSYHPLYEKPFFFTEEIPVLTVNEVDSSLMDTILELKKDVCGVAKNENLKKFTLNLKVNVELFEKLKPLNDLNKESDLCEILEVSSVNLEKVESVEKLEFCVELSQCGQCLRCRRYNAVENSDKCGRCENVLNSLD